MTDGMDRDELIGLLDQLGDESDQAVLAAARAIDAKVKSTGQTWDALLTRPAVAEAEGTAADPMLAEDDPGDAPTVATGPVPDDAESRRLIAGLLSGKGVSDDLRRELEDYKADIEAGEFGNDDRRYLKALHQRLTKA